MDCASPKSMSNPFPVDLSNRKLPGFTSLCRIPRKSAFCGSGAFSRCDKAVSSDFMYACISLGVNSRMIDLKSSESR